MFKKVSKGIHLKTLTEGFVWDFGYIKRLQYFKGFQWYL